MEAAAYAAPQEAGNVTDSPDTGLPAGRDAGTRSRNAHPETGNKPDRGLHSPTAKVGGRFRG